MKDDPNIEGPEPTNGAPSEKDRTDSTHRRSSGQASSPQAGLTAFWQELRRRHVVRVAITYAVVAWLIIQIAASTFEGFGIPDWAFRFVVIMVILGFPIAVLLAWAFELTPEGIKTTKTAKVQQTDSHEDKSHVKKRHWFSLGVAAAVPTLIFGVLAGFFYIQNRSLVSNTEAPVSDPVFEVEENEKSIAVLPLENMSPDPDNAFFANGVQEDILTNLSKIEELGVVISRSSTLKYRDPNRNLKQVGQELGVRYFVEGSVRRAANQVRVTVQLIDSQTDDHLWAENYDRSLDNIFAIQAEISKKIAEQLHAVISPQEIALIETRPTDNQEAYDAYVQYRLLLEIGGRHSQKIDLLEKAVEQDPDFAVAWARLGQERIFVWALDTGRTDSDLYSEAHFALDKAISINSQLPQVPFAQSYFADWEHRDFDASIDFLLAALDKDPNYIPAKRILGGKYLTYGRLGEAQHYLEAVYKNDPLSPRRNKDLYTVYKLRKDWEKGRALILRNLQISEDPSFWNRKLAELEYLQYGNRQRFIKERRALLETPNDPLEQAAIALISRDYDVALERLSIAEGTSPLEFIDGGVRDNSLDFGPESLLKTLIYFQRGDKGKWLNESRIAKNDLERRLEADYNLWLSSGRWSLLAISHALEGNREEMETFIEQARERSTSGIQKYSKELETEMQIAIAYIVLGDHEKAIETLEAASEMDGPIFLNRELDLWFIFDRLRGNPRFDALLDG